MLNAYNTTNQGLSANEAVAFTQHSIATCPTSHVAGSTTINITEPGRYFVTFNATAAATGTETNPITVQLFNNGTAVPGASSSELSAAATSPITLSFSTIIVVRPSCCVIDNDASLVVENTGADAVFTNANIVVYRIKEWN